MKDESSIQEAIDWLEKRKNSPSLQEQIGGKHYKGFVIQPILFHVANKLDGSQMAIFDYVLRHREKNGREDLDKAIHHLEMYRDLTYPK